MATDSVKRKTGEMVTQNSLQGKIRQFESNYENKGNIKAFVKINGIQCLIHCNIKLFKTSQTSLAVVTDWNVPSILSFENQSF